MTLFNGTVEEKKDRTAVFWRGQSGSSSLGRPVLDVRTKEAQGLMEYSGKLPQGEFCSNYTTKSLDYRMFVEKARLKDYRYYGEAIPHCSADLCAGVLALFLGCEAVEKEDTVWIEPTFEKVFEEGKSFPTEVDRKGFFWTFYWDLFKKLRAKHGEMVCSFPDIVEGIDIYGSMRGAQNTLMDIFDRPEEMLEIIGKIDDSYLAVYDEIYEALKDSQGGSKFWAWAPGKISKIQCDISAMMSPDMFDTFTMPTLRKLSKHFDYTLYHLDGPDALCHVDSLLTLEDVDIIQWEPGASHTEQGEGTWHPMWFSLYRRFLDSGKKVFLHHFNYAERFGDLKREFGTDLDKFYFQAFPETIDEAEKIMEQFI